MQTTRRGFTLIELMIVIAIIGILAAIALPHFSKVRERARQNKCWENSSLLSRMTELYNIEYRGYPDEVARLAPLMIGQRLPLCPTAGVYRWVARTQFGAPRVECSTHGLATMAVGLE